MLSKRATSDGVAVSAAVVGLSGRSLPKGEISMRLCGMSMVILFLVVVPSGAEDVKQSRIYARIKQSIDAVPAIDTHDHLRSFKLIPHRVATERGTGLPKASTRRPNSRDNAWPKR